MKNSILLLLNTLILTSPIRANDTPPKYEWIDAKDLAIDGDVVYADTNKGMAKLPVIDYDEENDRYLVEWPM